MPASASPASAGVHRKLKRAASVRGHAEPPALLDRLFHDARSGRTALCETEGASRAERATASSWPLIAVIEGDGRLKVWVLHVVTGLQRPNYQDPPGSRVLLGGSWPSWATPRLGTPHDSGWGWYRQFAVGLERTLTTQARSRLEPSDALLAVLVRGAGLQASGQPPLEGGLPVPDLPADVQARRSSAFPLPAPQRRQRHLKQLGGVLLGQQALIITHGSGRHGAPVLRRPWSMA